MRGIFDWIKANKLTALLLVIVLYFLYQNFLGYHPVSLPRAPSYTGSQPIYQEGALGGAPAAMLSLKSTDTTAPVAQGSQNRMVTQESYLSLVVKNVDASRQLFLKKAENLGGFMVQSQLSNPAEAATGTLTLRIPASKLTDALAYFKENSVKVVSENLLGEDVTDQYTDIEARMATLVKTKQKFEEILDKATAVQDILDVQRQLVSLQDQIDSLTGQKQYLEKNVAMAKITIYLSTDELALPYAPSEAWRPQLVFKEAVRSLILVARQLGNLAIYLVVFAVIWLPVLGIIYFLKRRRKLYPRP